MKSISHCAILAYTAQVPLSATLIGELVVVLISNYGSKMSGNQVEESSPFVEGGSALLIPKNSGRGGHKGPIS